MKYAAIALAVVAVVLAGATYFVRDPPFRRVLEGIIAVYILVSLMLWFL
jgi:hypothetical protein